jgi:hypothetical protein
MICRWPLAVAVAVLAASARVDAQSLADAARKEQERRAKQQGAARPAKTITEDELATTGQGGGTVSAPASSDYTPAPDTPSAAAGMWSARAATSAASGVTSAPSGAGEAYWRGRMASARSAVAAAEIRLKQAQDAADKLGPPRPGPRTAPCQAGTIVIPGRTPTQILEDSRKYKKTCGNDSEGYAQDRAYPEVERARSSLDAARKAVGELEEQARRAGALPGWLR